MAHFAGGTPGGRVFAYCLAEGGETAHHWQVFADRGMGACLVFDKRRLVEAVSADPHIRHREVAYVNWRKLPDVISVQTSLPFIKRQVYRAEREYRLIAAPPLEHAAATYELPIPLSCITSVYVSGEVPKAHFETFKNLVRTLRDCGKLPVRHSGLLQNRRWSDSLRTSSVRHDTQVDQIPIWKG
ncbi:hypothetical protein ABE438_16145 [Bosea sp. TWI1241]|uniref:hypothetical protein n=1 Tax=Bosea sp. TWI1241 TaxID=3148904 RepID=UPI00320B9623